MVSAADILLGLKIAISVMAIVFLYHLLFIAVDLRKVMRRVEEVTKEVEQMILKPLSVADQILATIMGLLEHSQKEKSKGKK